MIRLLMIALLSMAPSAGSAMIRTLPVTDLVAAADVIAIAEVVAISRSPSRPGIAPVRNELKVVRVLKGGLGVARTFVMRTYFEPGERAREDSPVFPGVGRRVLLFLRTPAGMPPVPVNGIQGLWPLEQGTDKTLGMGFRYSIPEIERLIAAPKSK
jgi:hypothetical protein